MIEIYIFNVGAGQAILIYPTNNLEHVMLIDCGGKENGFNFIPFLKNEFCLTSIRYLAITNYDHDHFSRLPELRGNFFIESVYLPSNISSRELKKHKQEMTEPLGELCNLIDTYINPVNIIDRPYNIRVKHLDPNDFGGEINTNCLSQAIFFEYKGSNICIPGDLECSAWEKLLTQPDMRGLLQKTNILIAPHHGRENGYHTDIFKYCNPEAVIISDKEIVHGTQDGMAGKYATHVKGNGIMFQNQPRKVLTTRNDGHILIRCNDLGYRNYYKI